MQQKLREDVCTLEMWQTLKLWLGRYAKLKEWEVRFARNLYCVGEGVKEGDSVLRKALMKVERTQSKQRRTDVSSVRNRQSGLTDNARYVSLHSLHSLQLNQSQGKITFVMQLMA